MAQIGALGLTNRVRLWGVRRDVATFYAAAEAFVLTSWGWEGLPITVVEAQAAALPVVVTDAGGAKEAFRPGRSGFLVPKSDPEALARALLTLLRDPSRRAEMGGAGRTFATQHFALARTVKQIVSLYNRGLGLDIDKKLSIQ